VCVTIVVSTGLVALDVRTFYFATIVARAAVTFLLPLIANLVGEPSVVLAATGVSATLHLPSCGAGACVAPNFPL